MYTRLIRVHSFPEGDILKAQFHKRFYKKYLPCDANEKKTNIERERKKEKNCLNQPEQKNTQSLNLFHNHEKIKTILPFFWFFFLRVCVWFNSIAVVALLSAFSIFMCVENVSFFAPHSTFWDHAKQTNGRKRDGQREKELKINKLNKRIIKSMWYCVSDGAFKDKQWFAMCIILFATLFRVPREILCLHHHLIYIFTVEFFHVRFMYFVHPFNKRYSVHFESHKHNHHTSSCYSALRRKSIMNIFDFIVWRFFIVPKS